MTVMACGKVWTRQYLTLPLADITTSKRFPITKTYSLQNVSSTSHLFVDVQDARTLWGPLQKLPFVFLEAVHGGFWGVLQIIVLLLKPISFQLQFLDQFASRTSWYSLKSTSRPTLKEDKLFGFCESAKNRNLIIQWVELTIGKTSPWIWWSLISAAGFWQEFGINSMSPWTRPALYSVLHNYWHPL